MLPFFLCVLVSLPVLTSDAQTVATPARAQTEVIFLTFRDPDLPEVAAIVEETETQILEGRNTPIHFSVEYLDPAIFPGDASHRTQAMAFLRERHQRRDFDLVITLDEQALRFVEEPRAKLFNDTPLIFSLDMRKNDSTGFNRPPDSTGVIRVFNYVPTLQMALRQNPGTQHVIVIAGSSRFEKLELQEAREEFRRYEGTLDVQYWTNLTLPELRTRLAAAGPQSVILLLDFLSDAAGEQFIPSRVLPTLAEGTTRPMYGVFSSFVGNGIVGGSVSDPHEIGHVLGHSSLRVLKGEKASDIPLVTAEFQRPMLDWRQLNRWGIARDQLPPASTVLFWESSPWQIYRWRIIGLSTVLIVETLLIALLLQMRARRRRAEENLRRKDEELSQARQVAQLCSWELDPKTDAVTWSDTFYSLTGFGPQLRPATFQQLAQFFTSESWERLLQALRKMLQTGDPYELELDAHRLNGSRLSILACGDVIRDHRGNVTRLRGTMQDISERKRAEDALRISEEKFSKAFRRSPVAISITTAQTHRYVEVNDTFERFSGYARDEVIGHTVFEVGLWLDPNERVRLTNKLLSNGKLENEPFDFRRRDGQHRIGQASAELIEINGELCVLGAIVDVTEQQHAEKALAESERRFRLMADSAPVLMWLSGPDKLCTDFNKAWLEFTGSTLQEQIGEGWTRSVHPDDMKGCLETYTCAFNARRSFQMEYRLRRHDGEYRWMLDRGTPRFHDDSSFAGYVGCCIDITDEKEAKLARMEFSGRLLHAQEDERARIARELHDDISQRLALLSNALQILERGLPQAQADAREQLHQLLQQAQEIANDIQGLSHDLHPSKLQYLGLASATRSFCQEFSAQHHLEIDCIIEDLPHDIEEDIALSLFRIVQESLHNVAKHSRADHVKVELSAHDSLVKLCVSDDGIGFDADDPKRQASGLGLVSMRERLRLVGGHLTVWSRPSLGTQIVATVQVQTRHHQQSA